jgi:hypothetical protein
MTLEKMPTGKLERLRAEVEAMIATKVAERREALKSQLSKLLEISGAGNGGRRGHPKTRTRRGEIPQPEERRRGLVRPRSHAALAWRRDQGRQRSGRLPGRLKTRRRKTA